MGMRGPKQRRTLLQHIYGVLTCACSPRRPHIPYRNSMMTMALKDSLGGNCRTTMVATISSEQQQLDESISTCRFAERVAMVKNQVGWGRSRLGCAIYVSSGA